MATTPTSADFRRFGETKPIRFDPHEAKNPLVSIWLEPRATLRFILSTDESLFVHTLAILAAITVTLAHAASNSVGDMVSLTAILLFSVSSALIIGILQLYLLASMTAFTGRFFGGRGRFGEIRAAIAWGSVPLVLSLFIIWTPCLLLFGEETFTSARPGIDASAMQSMVYLSAILLYGGLALWSLYITVAAVAEAHQISLIRGGFSLSLAWLILVVIAGALALSVIGGVMLAGGLPGSGAEQTPPPLEPMPSQLYAG